MRKKIPWEEIEFLKNGGSIPGADGVGWIVLLRSLYRNELPEGVQAVEMDSKKPLSTDDIDWTSVGPWVIKF